MTTQEILDEIQATLNDQISELVDLRKLGASQDSPGVNQCVGAIAILESLAEVIRGDKP